MESTGAERTDKEPGNVEFPGFQVLSSAVRPSQTIGRYQVAPANTPVIQAAAWPFYNPLPPSAPVPATSVATQSTSHNLGSTSGVPASQNTPQTHSTTQQQQHQTQATAYQAPACPPPPAFMPPPAYHAPSQPLAGYLGPAQTAPTAPPAAPSPMTNIMQHAAPVIKAEPGFAAALPPPPSPVVPPPPPMHLLPTQMFIKQEANTQGVPPALGATMHPYATAPAHTPITGATGAAGTAPGPSQLQPAAHAASPHPTQRLSADAAGDASASGGPSPPQVTGTGSLHPSAGPAAVHPYSFLNAYQLVHGSAGAAAAAAAASQGTLAHSQTSSLHATGAQGQAATGHQQAYPNLVAASSAFLPPPGFVPPQPLSQAAPQQKAPPTQIPGNLPTSVTSLPGTSAANPLQPPAQVSPPLASAPSSGDSTAMHARPRGYQMAPRIPGVDDTPPATVAISTPVTPAPGVASQHQHTLSQPDGNPPPRPPAMGQTCCAGGSHTVGTWPSVDVAGTTQPVTAVPPHPAAPAPGAPPVHSAAQPTMELPAVASSPNEAKFGARFAVTAATGCGAPSQAYMPHTAVGGGIWHPTDTEAHTGGDPAPCERRPSPAEHTTTAATQSRLGSAGAPPAPAQAEGSGGHHSSSTAAPSQAGGRTQEVNGASQVVRAQTNASRLLTSNPGGMFNKGAQPHGTGRPPSGGYRRSPDPVPGPSTGLAGAGPSAVTQPVKASGSSSPDPAPPQQAPSVTHNGPPGVHQASPPDTSNAVVHNAPAKKSSSSRGPAGGLVPGIKKTSSVSQPVSEPVDEDQMEWSTLPTAGTRRQESVADSTAAAASVAGSAAGTSQQHAGGSRSEAGASGRGGRGGGASRAGGVRGGGGGGRGQVARVDSSSGDAESEGSEHSSHSDVRDPDPAHDPAQGAAGEAAEAGEQQVQRRPARDWQAEYGGFGVRAKRACRANTEKKIASCTRALNNDNVTTVKQKVNGQEVLVDRPLLPNGGDRDDRHLVYMTDSKKKRSEFLQEDPAQLVDPFDPGRQVRKRGRKADSGGSARASGGRPEARSVAVGDDEPVVGNDGGAGPSNAGGSQAGPSQASGAHPAAAEGQESGAPGHSGSGGVPARQPATSDNPAAAGPSTAGSGSQVKPAVAAAAADSPAKAPIAAAAPAAPAPAASASHLTAAGSGVAASPAGLGSPSGAQQPQGSQGAASSGSASLQLEQKQIRLNKLLKPLLKQLLTECRHLLDKDMVVDTSNLVQLIADLDEAAVDEALESVDSAQKRLEKSRADLAQGSQERAQAVLKNYRALRIDVDWLTTSASG